MKTTVMTILLSSLMLCCFSCKEEKTTYEMHLIIENNTENSITIELFPNNEYKRGDMYLISDVAQGANYSKFRINASMNDNIFISGNINQQPYDLLSNVFDSIHISLNDNNQHLIKFSKDAVIGYSGNIFTDNSIWIYEIIQDSYPDQFKDNPVEVHRFTFEVSVDKLVN